MQTSVSYKAEDGRQNAHESTSTQHLLLIWDLPLEQFKRYFINKLILAIAPWKERYMSSVSLVIKIKAERNSVH